MVAVMISVSNAAHDYNVTKGVRYLGGWPHLTVPSLEKSFLSGPGSFLDAESPVVKDTLWVTSYSLIFGFLGGGVVIAGLLFVPIQLLCKVFSKNVPAYSWMDRMLTRVMLLVNIVFIMIFTIIGLWSTSAFYFNIEDPINELHDQVWVLRQKYEAYYTQVDLLAKNNPPYDILPAEPINHMYTLLVNRTGNMVEALDFTNAWVIRGAFGGFIPYTVPLWSVIFSFIYVLKGRRLMYTVALLLTLLSLFCMMGVAIPNSAWAILASYQCSSGIHSNMVRYLDYYNPGTCVPDVVRAYIWLDPITRSDCSPEPFASTQSKLDYVNSQSPSGSASFYLADAMKAWSVMRDTARTNALYDRVLAKGCGSTANRGATLFLSTILLWFYLLLHVYVLLFSTWRLKPNKEDSYNQFTNEEAARSEVSEQELNTFKSNIRSRIKRDQFELDNSNVLWTMIGWGFLHILVFLLLAIGFGVGSQKVTVSDP
jgi:hypothetical protein